MLKRLVVLALVGLVVRAAWAAPAGEYPLEVTGDSVRFVEQPARTVLAQGHVQAKYQDLTLAADELSADLDANTAVFKGHVVLSVRGADFGGETLFLDLDTRRWEFGETQATVSPSFFRGGVVAPLYLSGREVTGGPSSVLARGGSFTTCDLDSPHYHLAARTVTIYPGRKLIARHVSFWVGKRRLLALPTFWASLKEQNRQPFVPQAGSNDIDGTYLKTQHNYVLSDNNWGALHLDLMSRRGVGVGVDHNLQFDRGLSQVSLYDAANRATGETEFTARLAHEQQLSSDTTLRLTSDVRRHAAYYTAGSTVMSNSLQLTQQRAGSVTTLSISDSRSQGFTDLGATTVDLRHESTDARGARRLDLAYDRRTTFPGQADDQELNARLEFLERLRRLDLTLLASQRFDLDRDAFIGDNSYYALDRLPELVAATDLGRLGLARMAPLPTRLELRFGEFREQPTDLSAYRAYFGADASPRPWRLDSSTTLTTAVRFQQTAYGDADHTARYTYGTTANLRRELAPYLNASINYYLQQPKGYSPFQFDYQGRYQWASGGLTYQRGLRQRASLLTGFDLQTNRWQDLMARVETPLSRTVRLVGATSYSFNDGEQRDVVAQARFDDYRTALSLGLRYDPRFSLWRRVSAELDWRATDKWRLLYLTGYDGLERRFIYNEVGLIRDLHCWEARVYYSEQRRQFSFDLRIKAFEWGPGGFGAGRFGQNIDTSQGQPY